MNVVQRAGPLRVKGARPATQRQRTVAPCWILSGSVALVGPKPYADVGSRRRGVMVLLSDVPVSLPGSAKGGVTTAIEATLGAR